MKVRATSSPGQATKNDDLSHRYFQSNADERQLNTQDIGVHGRGRLPKRHLRLAADGPQTLAGIAL
jgi:hypothetical protein